MTTRKMSLAFVVWLGLCTIMLLAFAVQVVLADQCAGYSAACQNKPWANTCCTRGCYVYEWTPVPPQELEKFEVYVNPWLVYCCIKKFQTAAAGHYWCPDGGPACTNSWWWTGSGLCPED